MKRPLRGGRSASSCLGYVRALGLRGQGPSPERTSSHSASARCSLSSRPLSSYALHHATYADSANTVRLLLERGADIEPRNTIRALLEHGASTDNITFSADDPKPPSAEVAALLRDQIDAEPT